MTYHNNAWVPYIAPNSGVSCVVGSRDCLGVDARTLKRFVGLSASLGDDRRASGKAAGDSADLPLAS